MITVSFTIEEGLLQQLDDYAVKHGLKRSEVIREAIKKVLNQESSKVYKARIEKIKL